MRRGCEGTGFVQHGEGMALRGPSNSHLQPYSMETTIYLAISPTEFLVWCCHLEMSFVCQGFLIAILEKLSLHLKQYELGDSERKLVVCTNKIESQISQIFFLKIMSLP